MDLEKQNRIVQKGLIVFLAIFAIAAAYYIIIVISRIIIDHPNMKISGWIIIAIWFSIGEVLRQYFNKRYNNLKTDTEHSLKNPRGQEVFMTYIFITGVLAALTRSYWFPVVFGN